jgi:hypothetical protein
MAAKPVVKEAIVIFMASQDGPVTEPAIKRGITGDNWAKQNALRALVAEGTVMRQGHGTRGHPYRFSLALTGADSEHLAGEEPPRSTADPCRCGGARWYLTPDGWTLCKSCQARRQAEAT